MFSPLKVTRYQDRTVVEMFYAGGSFVGGGATEIEARDNLWESVCTFQAALREWVDREEQALFDLETSDGGT